MRKALAAGMAALTFGGAVLAAALPTAASAHECRGGYGYRGGGWDHDWDRHRHRGNDAAAAAVVAGIAGLAIGAALSDNHPRTYYNGGYYRPGYYDYGYRPYAQPYAMCESRRWVWDPYIGRRVLVTSRYEC